MRFLVLGGTSFVGRHTVEAAIAAGHDVTVFNRGQTNAGLFPDVDKRKGDRNTGDYASLAEGEWDAVIDVTAYMPRQVREAAAAVNGRAGHYTFVSTVSVYSEPDKPIDESSPVGTLDNPETEEVTDETYGPLKVLCEQAAETAFPGHTTVVRPGIVAGPFDPTDRFTYWVRRASFGGQLIGPPRADQPVQAVHARDQGDFIVSLTAAGTTGGFNSVGPNEAMTFASLLGAAQAVAGTELDIVWANEEFLVEHKAALPLVLPSSGGSDGLFSVSRDLSIKNGLRNRPLAETIADTLEWDRTLNHTTPAPGTIGPDREAELLELWKAR